MTQRKRTYSPDQGPLDRNTLESRLDLARAASYRLFLEVKSKDDFYFEDLLNTFIALVQQPVSFAIYKAEKNQTRELCFHFCSDKEHKGWFEAELESSPPNFTGMDREAFELFPELLDHKYFISIFLMHTKVLIGDAKTTRIRWSRKDEYPEDRKEYIAICAKGFFEEPWRGFYSLFGKTAAQAIESSIIRIAENSILAFENSIARSGWPVSADKIMAARRRIPRPNVDKESWHKKLREIFSRTMSTFEFGSHSISQLMHVDEEYQLDEGPFPQNMMVMYRAFDRDEEDTDTGRVDVGRHNNKHGSYQYNVRFLIDNRSAGVDGTIRRYLFGLRALSHQPNLYEASSSTRLLYRNITPASEYVDSAVKIREAEFSQDLFIALTAWMDGYFWQTISADDGVDECISILQKPVGNHSRSFCDPVFQTGLIHLNALFEKSGGLDRVDLTPVAAGSDELICEYRRFLSGDINDHDYVENFPKLEKNGKKILGQSLLNDLKRIVIFYYVFVGMASESGMNSDKGATYDPRNLTAILMPVKMRGAAWAVTVHATYMDVQDNEKSYEYLPFWMSNFLLMTSQRLRFSTIIDRVLWENIEHRVSKLLMKFIGEQRDADLDAALRSVNYLLAGEQRLLPYVFPEFVTNTSLSAKPVKSESYIDLLHDKMKKEGRVFQVVWRTLSNEFFMPRQPWNEKPRRSYKQAVNLGVIQGLRQQALELQKVAASKQRVMRMKN